MNTDVRPHGGLALLRLLERMHPSDLDALHSADRARVSALLERWSALARQAPASVAVEPRSDPEGADALATARTDIRALSLLIGYVSDLFEETIRAIATTTPPERHPMIESNDPSGTADARALACEHHEQVWLNLQDIAAALGVMQGMVIDQETDMEPAQCEWNNSRGLHGLANCIRLATEHVAADVERVWRRLGG